MASSRYAQKTYGRLTQSFGTLITRLVEPRAGMYTRLSRLVYTVSTTAHILTIMRPLNKTTLSSQAASSQAVINLTADPGDYSTVETSDNGIAASDHVVIQLSDGSFQAAVVQSVATLAITLTANVNYTTAAGNSVWFYGVATDTNPNDSLPHARFNAYASGTLILGEGGDNPFFSTVPGVLSGMTGKFEPLIVQADNGTAAGYLEYVEAFYDNRGG